MASRGIIYEYEDGGRFCGEWENDMAHGHGVCTGPSGNGLFEGLWERGNQSSGVFTWPNGQKYMGKWRQGVREGAGKETKKDGTEYCGEFTRDSRCPYGVLRQPNGVVYRGTWSQGVQKGEGTELYIDGGIYRGEYSNGMRHGHGTRSSANYERSTAREPQSVSSSNESVENLASTLEDPSSVPVSVTISLANKTNAQIYEGEWRDDKRHGYGVLRIVGHHTYYGQWEENMRNGHGVMIYDEEKKKEEGQWQRGKLVQKLKRKKLQLKSKQLESKVNQAHMCALQAAETARSKANLAEGRASMASAKDRTAVRAAQQALKDAEIAHGIEKLHKNAPKIQEKIRSPVTESYTAGDIATGREPSDAATKKLLRPPPCNIPPTPSFEDLASIASGVSIPRTADNSSGSNESLDEGATQTTTVTPTNQKSRFSHENPSPELWRRKQQPQQLDVQSKREQFKSSRHSSADLMLHRQERGGGGGGGEGENASALDTSNKDGDIIRHRRLNLLKIHQGTESDPMFSSHHPLAPVGDKGEGRVRSASSSLLLDTPSVSEAGGRGIVTGERESELRPRHINKATGEPDHGEVTDEEEQLSAVKSKPTPTVEQYPQAVSVEVLQQMAHWNKMVAYLNLALLFILLLLLISLVIFMNYFWLLHQMPTTTASGSLDIDPSYLSSGPMA